MEYAIVRLGGKQYKVSKGEILEVDKQHVELNGQAVLDDVLLFVSDGKIKIGNPRVADTKVKALVLEHKKGEKIRVAKFKAKVRYRRVMGFRPLLTRLQITDIGALDTKEESKTSASKSVSKTVPKRSVRSSTKKVSS